MSDEQVILNIGLTSSECESCGLGANPRATAHNQTFGYGAAGVAPPEPCYKRFTHVTTNYHGLGERVQEMRPDLTYINRTGTS